MILNFYKYQGTGNDFVMIDNREAIFDKSNVEMIQKLCNRKFGIGADGLILIEKHSSLDFTMIYFNADGSQSFCGNGSRCAVSFAKFLGIISNKAAFLSTDGEHEAWIDENGEVGLKMHDVSNVESGVNYSFLNTGSPHYIVEVDDIIPINVVEEGRKIRYNNRFKSSGTNVNFVCYKNDLIYIRTYERGVEDETLSCGTGVTAAAINHALKNNISEGTTTLLTSGGKLQVKFKQNQKGEFTDIWLIGQAEQVYTGTISLK
ncbi:MAG: diaminopimelate epimerase [Flavobacteriales bacterium]|nr:diaminopimelate epimerase [Flavobacteriales bacterium]